MEVIMKKKLLIGSLCIIAMQEMHLSASYAESSMPKDAAAVVFAMSSQIAAAELVKKQEEIQELIGSIANTSKEIELIKTNSLWNSVSQKTKDAAQWGVKKIAEGCRDIHTYVRNNPSCVRDAFADITQKRNDNIIAFLLPWVYGIYVTGKWADKAKTPGSEKIRLLTGFFVAPMIASAVPYVIGDRTALTIAGGLAGYHSFFKAHATNCPCYIKYSPLNNAKSIDAGSGNNQQSLVAVDEKKCTCDENVKLDNRNAFLKRVSFGALSGFMAYCVGSQLLK